MPEQHALNPRRLVITTSISALVFLLAMSFLFYQGNRMDAHHVPQMHAVMNIKLEATTAHLWFEEILSGDRNESMSSVWTHIDQADWYAEALLRGGRRNNHTYQPLNEPALREAITLVRAKLENFRQIAVQRYENLSGSEAGSDLDQEFDRVFQSFIHEADFVQQDIQGQIAADLRQFKIAGGAILVLATLLALLFSVALYQRERQKQQLLQSLSESNHEIEQKNLELNFRANYDPLTQLPNRTLFTDRLAQTILESKRMETSFALLFIDLDHFKTTNDRYGHQAGDQLLQQTAVRISRCLRELDTASRISGDEFMVLLKTLKGQSHAVETAQEIASRLTSEMSQPFRLGEVTSYVTASIGVAIYPDDGDNAEALMLSADSAMYHAKEMGRNRFELHSQSLSTSVQQRITIEHDLREALQERQLIAYYQPQWELQTKEITALEALVRWQHPEHGLIAPDQFIEVAEKIGLIHLIDYLVLEDSLKQTLRWHAQGFKLKQVAVNISPYTFHRQDFLSTVVELLTRHQVSGDSLEIEITEHALLEDSDYSREVLANLKKLGVTIAIDDFGTGFSSMSYLRDLQIDTLKIDKSFIDQYQDNAATGIILRNIIQLGRSLGLNVVAEGIETERQEQDLTRFGCQTGQGYLCAKPLPVEQINAQFVPAKASNVLTLKPNCKQRSNGLHD
ncbi:EAL domain-containing protein [Motiliproteus coralliicola]|uniref:cyclic-guanylate-specific phosphodiesterase n=1 Tax=Motiliproteus coralliicola TaxID=2283196 RepID=A0A369WC86_9GAMM|nr:EAL domain-containing protein [Motiliproteus coralliicola]RDE18941.1 EAL domain-containing protein [Motiliproteus coralliicola]